MTSLRRILEDLCFKTLKTLTEIAYPAVCRRKEEEHYFYENSLNHLPNKDQFMIFVSLSQIIL